MPDYWLSKSELNLDAAEKLKNSPNNHHGPSISCSYYACYLRITYTLNIILGYDEKKFNGEYNAYKARTQGGSHDFLIHLVYKAIAAGDPQDATDFKNEILALRKLRITAHYQNVWQEKDQSDLAYNKAETIIKILKRRRL